MKVSVYVDISNLFFALKSTYDGGKLNYKKLYGYCSELGEVVVARAYGGYFKGNKKFIDALTHAGFEPRFQPCKVYKERVKCNVDPELSMDIIEHVNSTDTDMIILCSADGDFRRTIEYCQSKRVRVTVIARQISKALLNVADHCVEIPRSLLYEDDKSK